MSLTTPSDIYYKSRRLAIISSGILFLIVFAGLAPGSSDGSISIFSFKLRTPESIPHVFAAVLLYALWQLWESWMLQSMEVQNFLINKIDIYTHFSIATFSLFSYAWVYIISNTLEIVVSKYKDPIISVATTNIIAALATLVTMVFAVKTMFRTAREMRKTLDKAAEFKEAHLYKILTEPESKWYLLFNPEAGKGKTITFEVDGRIGEGKNNNEATWRVREGTLEILNQEGKIFSRFRYNGKEQKFEHTNDDDTLSIRSQIISKITK